MVMVASYVWMLLIRLALCVVAGLLAAYQLVYRATNKKKIKALQIVLASSTTGAVFSCICPFSGWKAIVVASSIHYGLQVLFIGYMSWVIATGFYSSSKQVPLIHTAVFYVCVGLTLLCNMTSTILLLVSNKPQYNALRIGGMIMFLSVFLLYLVFFLHRHRVRFINSQKSLKGCRRNKLVVEPPLEQDKEKKQHTLDSSSSRSSPCIVSPSSYNNIPRRSLLSGAAGATTKLELNLTVTATSGKEIQQSSGICNPLSASSTQASNSYSPRQQQHISLSSPRIILNNYTSHVHVSNGPNSSRNISSRLKTLIFLFSLFGTVTLVLGVGLMIRNFYIRNTNYSDHMDIRLGSIIFVLTFSSIFLTLYYGWTLPREKLKEETNSHLNNNCRRQCDTKRAVANSSPRACILLPSKQQHSQRRSFHVSHGTDAADADDAGQEHPSSLRSI